MKQIGADIRNKCRAEIDEYVNCSAETNLVMFKCKNEAKELYKCVRIYQKDAATPEAQQKVMEERVRKGESVLKEIHL
ncbi:hypothetical protein BEWA_054570 [Theileria equi strain WA]|uniref:COX assembly mitochondrial protein n=1 Tax=Theileria equi strain WA TaxID=1537102 RepID=L1LDH6_THEEQ|nr:hypothetical protein BEWA_054570 [Theileria equi strain WA]EKX73401.1 hypothetical protein BEWA_054570 [Theileria equi strain WA]|eukprot:XP_004832853.1 hypothetical protein BEWA_054570 [Theileria equi strain WA]